MGYMLCTNPLQPSEVSLLFRKYNEFVRIALTSAGFGWLSKATKHEQDQDKTKANNPNGQEYQKMIVEHNHLA